MPTEDTAPGRGHTLFAVVQLAVASFLSSVRLRPDFHVARMTKAILNEHIGVPSTALCHSTCPVTENGTPEESINLESQPIDGQVIITSREPVGPLGPSLRDHNNPFAYETHNLEEASRPATGGQHGSSEGPSIRSKHTKMRMAALSIGLLSLIVVPGLVLGIVRKEIPVGIALSGAIATVASFFAGFYYYHNR